MPKRQPSRRMTDLPRLWLLSDARSDTVLERALARLPRGSGFVFRHYHLPKAERLARYHELARLARRRGHHVMLSGTPREARRWRADGAYGTSAALARGPALFRLVTVHSMRELRRAHRADAVMLSPVFPTRSHPGGMTLGPLRFRRIAAHARVPIIALGGMNPDRARRLKHAAWAAIDGLAGRECDQSTRRIPDDS